MISIDREQEQTAHSVPVDRPVGRSGRHWGTLVKAALTILLVLLAGRTLWRQWSEVRLQHFEIHPSPAWLLASSALVFVAYLILIESWRLALATWGAHVPFGDAARVWFVSNLGKYVPGKIWQITAMGMMLQRRGISLAVAGSAAVIVTIANVLVGLGLVFALGASALTIPPELRRAAGVAVLLLGAMLLASPRLVPLASGLISRMSRREAVSLRVPNAAPWLSAVGSLAAWVLYGVAFRLFSVGLIGHAEGSWSAYIAVYSASYLIGYLALFAPGGIGVREIALTTALPALGLATPPEAAMLTVASRLWLTVLEVVPGVALLLVRRRQSTAG
ncbi:MAG TPA: lysylphosphatidylglycerol synthase transmembrane domain-containing protein [Gemmatimonadaceae bacterium]|nr:lysylphosphatidylglycerol synthase transmembrane domain-containing protein [Gemmatimonadaceae bacterium]